MASATGHDKGVCSPHPDAHRPIQRHPLYLGNHSSPGCLKTKMNVELVRVRPAPSPRAKEVTTEPGTTPSTLHPNSHHLTPSGTWLSLDDMAGWGQGLTNLVAVMGILDMVWEWRQWVQVILPLSQQACCGEAKHEGVPHRNSRGPEAFLGRVSGGQAGMEDPKILQPGS